MTILVCAGLFAALNLAAAVAAQAREPLPQGEVRLPTLPAYNGTWAASTEECRNPSFLHQRITIDAKQGFITDNRAGDTECRIVRQKHYAQGSNLDLVCQYGQETPFNFRTDISLLRTGAGRLNLTNSFVDRKPETLDLIRCRDSDVPTRTVYPSGPDGALTPPHELPPLREGEFYAGQAYPADYAERRTELLGAKAKPLPRVAGETCIHAFCKRYPEIRACYADYCVGRWERADGATVDYVVKPDDLTVLKTVCRDTCGADEIRPPAR